MRSLFLSPVVGEALGFLGKPSVGRWGGQQPLKDPVS